MSRRDCRPFWRKENLSGKIVEGGGRHLTLIAVCVDN
jgi:hypothetical protein